jgi:hypothetical protein
MAASSDTAQADTAQAGETATTAETDEAEAAPVAEAAAPELRGVLEVAANARAKCRACSASIGKGSLRVGVIAPNPFAEGETTYWFHSECAARRLPAAFQQAATEASSELAAPLLPLLPAVERRVQHPRLARLSAVDSAPTGRARCRQCRQTIDKGSTRVALSLFNSGRFDPIGYAHLTCLEAYVGTGILPEDLSLPAPLPIE